MSRSAAKAIASGTPRVRIPLLWRMILPTVAVSLLLLTLGIATAVVVHVGNVRTSQDLDARVETVIAVEELLFAMRDIRLELLRYLDGEDPQFLQQARAAAVRMTAHADEVADSPLAIPGYGRLHERLAATGREVAGLEGPPPAVVETLRQRINEDLLPQSYALLQSCRTAAFDDSRRNRAFATQIGGALALLGVCGSAAGLLAGYGVARGVSRTIDQLGGSLRSVAESLEPFVERAPRPTGLRDLLVEMTSVQELAEGVANELEQSRVKAARVDQLAAVGQLAAGIAHELRNPLTAIKLLADAAAERGAPLEDAELAVLRLEANRMQQMLQSFLDFARPPRLARQPVDVGQAAVAAVELVRPQAQRVHVEVTCHATPTPLVSADPQQLRQVLLNLLINAIDAQPSGGAVRVKVAPADDDEPEPGCVVEVADDGPGISAELRERIFEPFVSTKETGVGLGLTISQRIVRSHGGELTVGDGPDRGAVFRAYLPSEPPTRQPVPEERNP